jgi:hypothetical protein
MALAMKGAVQGVATATASSPVPKLPQRGGMAPSEGPRTA